MQIYSRLTLTVLWPLYYDLVRNNQQTQTDNNLDPNCKTSTIYTLPLDKLQGDDKYMMVIDHGKR